MSEYSEYIKKPATQSSSAPPVIQLQTRPFAPPQVQPSTSQQSSEQLANLSSHENLYDTARWFSGDRNHDYYGSSASVTQRKWAETVQRYKEKRAEEAGIAVPIQAKLAIGAVGDKYEQEADRVAEQVVQKINDSESVQREEVTEEEEQLQMKPAISSIQREEMSEEEDELQMKPDDLQREAMPDEEDELQRSQMLQQKSGEREVEATSDLESAIQGSCGNGQPLTDSIRQPMEQAFGTDFSGVKIHTDSKSDSLNKSIQAKAFTTGQDVFFRRGAYEPSSRGGQELIAHELTHVVQQNKDKVQRSQSQGLQLTTPLQSSQPFISQSILIPKANNLEKMIQRVVIGKGEAAIDTGKETRGDAQKKIRQMWKDEKHELVEIIVATLNEYIEDSEYFPDAPDTIYAIKLKDWILNREEYKEYKKKPNSDKTFNTSVYKLADIPYDEAKKKLDEKLLSPSKNKILLGELAAARTEMEEAENRYNITSEEIIKWSELIVRAAIAPPPKKEGKKKKSKSKGSTLPILSGEELLNQLEIEERVTKMEPISSFGEKYETHLSLLDFDDIREKETAQKDALSALHITVECFGADDERNPRYWIITDKITGRKELLNSKTQRALEEQGKKMREKIDDLFK
ncbi:hypothetical protein TUMEXPCC7403_10610 [Tumidithrix helvetica PCC 7403]|uniref:eCIS core domain-containing protein n=1 Tax=Tumidithrix helvetica TaxID=3457545 RepID=UPI003CAE4ADC